MTEPNVKKAAAPREDAQVPAAPRVQLVTMKAKGVVTVPEDDERVANLVRMGMSLVEARAAVSQVSGMW